MSRFNRTTRLLAALIMMSLWSGAIAVPNTHAQTVTYTYNVDRADDTQFSSPPLATACANPAANDDCSLREALLKANFDTGPSIINFIIPATSGIAKYNYDGAMWTIEPTTELPHIQTNDTQIVGTAIDGIVPRIVIDGKNLPTTGLTINNASGNKIKNLAIINFKAVSGSLGTGNGIRIMGSSSKNNEVVGCYLGADPRGGTITAAGNQQAGLLVSDSASGNRIGLQEIQTKPTDPTNIIIPNYISGNGTSQNRGDGILLSGSSATTILGNNIGIVKNNFTTSAPLGNAGNGIHIYSSNGNVIGGANADSLNIISSNVGAGILIESSSNGNNIYSNLIGLDKLGGVAIPNESHGIHIFDGAYNNRMVGFLNAPLVISGNGSGKDGGYGVLISGQGTNNNTLQGAYVGVNVSGAAAIPNQSGGVKIQNNASNNNIGTAEIPNVISGNNGYGISLSQEQAGNIQLDNTSIKNNIIGLGSDVTSSIPNRDGGISVGGSSRFTTIGGSEAEQNIISSNGTANVTIPIPGGIVISSAVIGTTIQGNIIGLKRATINGPFNTAAANQGSGIYVAPLASTVTIGGDATQKNKIAYNVGDGIQVNVGASNITITSNDVTTNTLHGINLTGVTAPIINDNNANNNGRSAPGTGILLSNAPNAQVLRNTANLNSEHGISVSSSNNLLLNNSTANQNTLNGIFVTSVLSSTLAANTANRNGNNGVFVSASDAAKISATTASLNLNSGLLLGLSTRVTITGTTAESNALHGMSLVDTGPFTATDNLTLRANQRAGFRASGSFNHSQIRNNNALANLINGFVLQGPTSGLTQHITMTNNLAEGNTGSGLLIDGALKDVLVQKNNFYSNSVNGVQLGGTLTPQPQQIKLDENSFTANGIPANTPNPVPASLYGNGIVLNPETRLAGTATNPNHDIDPPVETSLVAWDNGQFTGRVLTGTSPDACLPTPITPAPVPVPICKLQIFSTDAQRLDGQGFALLKNVNVSANGYFTTTLGLGVVPKQLALTATDMYSNTSEFALFNVNPSLLFDTAQAKQARPGDTVTFVHTLTNNGNVAFTNVQLGFEATKNNIRLTKWDVSAKPTGAMTIKPGETKTVTTTVKLPLGSDTEVAAGTVGNVKLVAQTGNTPNASLQVEVVDTLTILPRVVLDVQPTALPGSGRPGEVVTYLHTVTNNGNVAATVAISYNTLVAGGTAPTWTTVLEPPTTMTLQAGQSLGLTVKVTVSQTSQLGTEAQTIIKLTPSTNAGVDLTQEKTVTDTTRTTLDPAATLVPPSQELPGAAGEVTSFQHCATNISNGEATFKIQAVSSQGSSVTFSDNDPLVNLVNGNSFTLAQGANFCFFVNVNVERRLLPGQKDVVTVVLQDAQGGSIGGASAQDTINVQRGIMYPRLYLPLVLKP